MTLWVHSLQIGDVRAMSAFAPIAAKLPHHGSWRFWPRCRKSAVPSDHEWDSHDPLISVSRFFLGKDCGEISPLMQYPHDLNDAIAHAITDRSPGSTSSRALVLIGRTTLRMLRRWMRRCRWG